MSVAIKLRYTSAGYYPGSLDNSKRIAEFGEMGYVLAHRAHNTPLEIRYTDGLVVPDKSGYITLVANPGWSIYDMPKMKAYNRNPNGNTALAMFIQDVPVNSMDTATGVSFYGVGHRKWITWHSSDFPYGTNLVYIDNVHFAQSVPKHLQKPPKDQDVSTIGYDTIPKPKPQYIDDNTLPIGVTQLISEGNEGREKVYYMVIKLHLESIRYRLFEEIVVHARPDVYARGTGNFPIEEPNGPGDRETMVIRPVKPTREGDGFRIPSDKRLVYKNEITGQALVGYVEFSRTTYVRVELADGLPRDYIYKLEGDVRWVFDATSPGDGLVSKVDLMISMLAGFRSRNPLTGAVSTQFTTTRVLPSSWSELVDITIDGIKVSTEDTFGIPGYDKYTGAVKVSTGYRHIKISLNNQDFRWDTSRANHLFLGGSNGNNGVSHAFETDDNGDMVWEGTIRNDSTVASLDIFPVSEHFLYLNEIVAPQVTSTGDTFYIPEHPQIEYRDADTSEVLTPGIHQLVKHTTIFPRLKFSFVKMGDTYHNYFMKNLGEFWTLSTDEKEKTTVTAPAPKQEGYILNIPKMYGVSYWDNIALETVTGSIDLRTRRNQRVNIQPFAEFSNYTILNKDEVWSFIANTTVRAQPPTIQGNRITIPLSPGVQYVNNITKELLKGTFEISNTITIKAVAIDGYTLSSTVNEWVFTEIKEAKTLVTASPITISGNWITVPSVTGIRYFNQATNKTLQGTMYVQEQMTVAVETISDKYAITNMGITWIVIHQEIPKKEIVLVDRGRNTIIQLNNTVVHPDTFTVDAGELTTITLTFSDGSEFDGAPYLKDTNGEIVNFTVEEGNKKATLSITFDDETPSKIIIPKTKQTEYSITFLGINAKLEAIMLDGTRFTLRQGETGTVKLDSSYTFNIHANKDYVFDRQGQLTYGGKSSPIALESNIKAQTRVDFIRGNITVYIEAVQILAPELPSNTIGFNNLYLMDKPTLMEVSREMLIRKRQFMISPGGAGGMNYDSQLVTDPHTYIINTIQLPFKIEDRHIINRQRIVLGFTTLRPSAPRLDTDKLSIDLGTIKVEPKYNNAYDYKNTDIILHLPYSGPIHLDPNYTIGETIAIEYMVDAYTGHTTINLRSTFVNDNVFHSTETYIGNEIPFISMKDGSTIGSTQESRSLVNNNTPVPYIEVIRNIPYQMDSEFNSDTIETVSNLRNTKGRIYVHNISIESDCTITEQLSIKSILAGGIIIK